MVDVRVLHGDCVELMRGMPENSVDSIVTDPPYELGFMGKQWDGTGIAYDVAMWGEVLRVLKPGGHLLAFGGTRTFHRMTVAIEDAGFEVRDCLSWLYGSGFPKSLNVGKAIDKAAGAEREVVGTKDNKGRVKAEGWRMSDAEGDAITAPATDEAARWEGWGTALKPAWEPIVMARKPFKTTVAQNVLEWGTGALNIDGSRIGKQPMVREAGTAGIPSGSGNYVGNVKPRPHLERSEASGRWPANVMFDEAAAALLDEQVEASRFFYVAKASRRDRNEGLDGMPEGHPVGGADKWTEVDRRKGEGVTRRPRANVHPTVKPTALMRHLVKLVTPPNGLVLDPFTGSGSTGKAAVLEGFRFLGIEQDEQYAEIARARIGWARQETVRLAKETAPSLFDGN